VLNFPLEALELKSLEETWITSRQIEAARQAITRRMKREGQLWIRIFPINLLPKNLLKYVWVKVKVLLSISLQEFAPVVFCLKLKELLYETAKEAMRLRSTKTARCNQIYCQKRFC
jgi:large subunit ribosomal protein L16